MRGGAEEVPNSATVLYWFCSKFKKFVCVKEEGVSESSCVGCICLNHGVVAFAKIPGAVIYSKSAYE